MPRVWTALAALVVAISLAPAAQPQERVPRDSAEIQLSFAPVVRRASPAVVNVYASRSVNRSRLLDDPFFRDFFGGRGMSPHRRLQSSLGSGVIVEAQGIVITNDHVIDDADRVKVALEDGREFPAEILLRDERTDLAVLRIQSDEETFPVLEFGDSDALETGDLVLAIGNPFGVGQTVTSGIVSAVARTNVGVRDMAFFIQTDAAINPGNSGGALVDMAGRLVGINTAIFSRSGGSNGIGFAIPAAMAERVLVSALEGDSRLERPYLGAQFQNVTPDIALGLGLRRPSGALIVAVNRNGPAARAGLRRGDVVLAVDGRPVSDAPGLNYRLAVLGPGREVVLTILRENRRREVRMLLEALPEFDERSAQRVGGRSPLSGAAVVDIAPSVIEALRLSEDSRGVVIVDVAPGSPALRAGLKRGDIVVAIQGRPVATAAEVLALAGQPSRNWLLVLERSGRALQLRWSTR